MRLKVTKKDSLHRVQKSWGYEIWIENRVDYCGKILHVKKGCSGSLHYHLDKTETMYVQRGHVGMILLDPEEGETYCVELFPGDSIRLEPGQAHQLYGIKDSDIFEFSTHHEDSDSYRIEKGIHA